MSGSAVPLVHLNSGHDMPLVGLGTSPMGDDDAATAVASAIEVGYRLFDTAARYGNEKGVGQGLRAAGVPREELFVTSKLRGAQQGYASTRTAVEESLDRLGLDYLDLYLIHWPLPLRDLYVESYRAMLELAAEGLIRSVGVSNFLPAHIERLDRETRTLPAVNQIQLSPALCRIDSRDYHDANGIITQGWSPLGQDEKVPEAPIVTTLADKHGVTPAQIILRWAVQQGISVVPKSAQRERQATNLDLFSFELNAAEIAALTALDLGDEAAVDPELHEEF